MRYRVWTFDPVAFHRWLDPQVIVGGEFSPHLLRDVAMRVAESDSEVIADYLACFGLSKDDQEAWADTFNDTVFYHLDEWYVYVMGSHVAPCVSPSMTTYERLQWLLPMSQTWWNAYKTGGLLDGSPLQWLVEDYGHEQLHKPLRGALRGVDTSSGGGWLPLSTARQYRRWLDEPPRGVRDQDLAAYEGSIEEIKIMLDEALDRDAALRMVIDL